MNNIKRAFTKFPAAIATYIAIAGFIGLLYCNRADIAIWWRNL